MQTRLRPSIGVLAAFAVFVALLSGGPRAQAKDSLTGLRLYPKTADVPVRVENRVIAKGADIRYPCKARRFKGDWLWVVTRKGEGWIARADVVPQDRAIAYFTGVLSNDPENTYALQSRASEYLARRELPKALDDLDRGLRKNPTSVQSLITRGNVRALQTYYSMAIRDFNEALRLDPQNAVAYSDRAAAWLGYSEFDKALADITEALRLDPTYAVPYFNRGRCWQSKRDLDKALADYSEAIRLDPEFGAAYVKRGGVWLLKEDFDKAIADLSEAIRLEPEMAEAYESRAQAWAAVQNSDKAQADREAVARLSFRRIIAGRPPSSRGEAVARKSRIVEQTAFEGALTLLPETLAQNYLQVRYELRLTEWAKQGATIHSLLDGKWQTVTSANAQEHAAEMSARLKAYGEAIKKRGYFRFRVVYFALASHGCDQYGLLTGPVLVEQDGYRLRLYHNGVIHEGVVVESSVALEHATIGPDVILVGRADEDRIPFNITDRGEAAVRRTTGCTWTLTEGRDTPEERDAPTYAARALANLREGICEKALRDADTARGLDPKLAPAYGARAAVWATCPDEKVRDGKKAIASALRACELSEWKDWFQLSALAAAYAESGDFKQAIAWTTKAREIAPVQERDELEEMLKLYQEGSPFRVGAGFARPSREAELQPQSIRAAEPDPRMLEVIKEALEGRTGQAKAQTSPADVQKAESLRARADVLMSKDQLDEAIKEYSKAIRLDPQNAKGYVLRGYAWQRKWELERALQDFSEAIRLDPEDCNLYGLRGIIWRGLGDLARARDDLNKALQINPEYALAYRERGIVSRMEGEYDKSIDDSNAAIRFAPQAPNSDLANQIVAMARASRGAAWMGKGDFDKALADLDESIRLNAGEAEGYAIRGDVWAAKGDLDRALQDYDAAIARTSHDPEAYFDRGSVWERKQHLAHALRDYDQAIRVNPRFAPAYDARARIWATSADPKYRHTTKAVESAQKACELANWHEASFIETLAAAHAAAGRIHEAVEWQTRAIDGIKRAKASEAEV
ncbi:MAG: tetratricopeptide repeat protein, partial [Rudaea sp.]